MHRRRQPSGPRGFTLIELLVVIGILVLLMAILVPVVSHVRLKAYDTSTQAQMQRILQACESYYHDFNAYPGPVANVNLFGGSNAVAATGLVPIPITGVSGPNGGKITSSENLVLGLLGLLNPPTASNGGQISFVPASTNPPHDVVNLSKLHPGVPSYHYIDYVPGELSAGILQKTDATAMLPGRDTNVPEFIDRFPDPMPILYIRANVGGTGTPAVFQNDQSGGLMVQYNFMELSAYGCNVQTNSGGIPAFLDISYFKNINTYATATTGTTLSDTVTTPYADWNGTTPVPNSSPTTYNGYLMNPNIGGAVRGKDGFILLSAGVDRTYGTTDDTILTP